MTAESLAARGKGHSPTAIEQWEQQRLAAMSQQQRFDEGLRLSSAAMAMCRRAPDHQPISGKVFIL